MSQTVLTLSLARSVFSDADTAARWARAHGYSATRPEHTEDAYVFRQAKGAGTCEEWDLSRGAVVSVGRAYDPTKRVPPTLSADDLINEADLVRSWELAAAKPTARALAAGYADKAESLGMRLFFDVAAPRVAGFLRDRAAGKVSTIATNRIDELREVIRSVIEAQGTVQELASEIRTHFERGPSAWAARIARTETAGLYTQAGLWAMGDAGVERKQWISSRDASVRPSHVEADGQTVALSEDFVLAGGKGPGPGLIDAPEESINCRCAVLEIIGEAPDVGDTVSRADVWAKHDAKLTEAEMAMASAWLGLFDAMGEAVLAKLEEVVA